VTCGGRVCENAEKMSLSDIKTFRALILAWSIGSEILVGEKWKQRRELKLLSKDPQPNFKIS